MRLEYLILKFIADGKNPFEVASKNGLRYSQVAQILKELVELGFVSFLENNYAMTESGLLQKDAIRPTSFKIQPIRNHILDKQKNDDIFIPREKWKP